MTWWRQFFLEAIDLVDWLLAWSIGVVWAVAVLWALYQFSPTQAFARTLTRELGLIFLVWFIAGIASRIASIAIARFVHVWQLRPFGLDEDSARRHLRSKTIQSALEYAVTALIVIVGVGITLSALGASASAVVTVGAAFAFAVSFGAQSLVKDFVNGFFILIEDQYAIGDFVTIGGVEGFVNDLTLRITRLRSGDARLITIPNSQVAVVENWTKNYSRLDYRIAVSFDCDLELALRVFTDVLNEVAQDPHWRSLINEPPKILGVDSVASTGAVLLGQIRTSPGVMFELRREINRRMLTAFAAQGIPLGMPTSRAAPVATSPKPAQDTGTQQPPT